MNHPELIGAGYLEAIRNILNEVQPDLAHHIQHMVANEPSRKPPVRGQSVFADYPFVIRTDDAKAILTALERAQEIYGPEHRVSVGRGASFPLSAVIAVWRGHTAKLPPNS